jgi:hypothetical protein
MRAGAYLLAASLLFGCGARTQMDDSRAFGGGPSGGAETSAGAPAIGGAAGGSAPTDCAPPSTDESVTWTQLWELAGAVGVTTDGLGRPLLEINGPRGEVDLFKLDARGQTLWSHSFEGNGRFPVPVVLSTNQAGDSVVFSRSVNMNVLQPFAALVEATGDVRWRRDPVEIAGRFWDVMTVALDASGRATVVGFADYPVDVGGGLLGGDTRHAFVFQLDATGAHAWSFGLGGLIDLPELASFPDGSVLLTGTLQGALSFAGVELSSEYGAPFIARLSPVGEVVFARVLDTRDAAAIHDLAVAPDGSFYLALAFSNELDLGADTIHAEEARTRAVIKFASDGELAWSRILGTALIELSLATSHTQELVMAAGFRNTLRLGERTLEGGEWSTFAAKLDDDAKVTWLEQWPGASEASPSIAADRCGGVFASVTFRSEYDTGREVLENMPPPIGTPPQRYVTPGQSAAALLHFGPVPR